MVFKKVRLKHYQYFWIASIILLLAGFVSTFFEELVIDINVHDTYFIIHESHIAFTLCFYYLVFGLIYYLFSWSNIQLIRILTSIHTIISVGIILAYFIGLLILDIIIQPNNTFPLFDDISYHNWYVIILIFILMIAQLLFILNLGYSTIRYGIQKVKNK